MNYDVIVVGGGPGGYVAAIRASQLGLKTAVVEMAELGGVCLNWGCIPTKSLLKSAEVLSYIRKAGDYGISVPSDVSPDFDAVISRSRKVAAGMSKGVQFLMKKNSVEHISGRARLIAPGSVEVTGSDGEKSELSAPHIIFATGARSRQLPGLEQDGKVIVGYREAMTLPRQPGKMLVVGSGAIGTEFAWFYHTMGTEVTLVEYLSSVVPNEDEDVSKQLERTFKKEKMKIYTDSTVSSVEVKDGKAEVVIKRPSGEVTDSYDVVLSAVGVTPNTEDLGLEESGVSISGGKVVTDNYYRTAVKGVYAIGDIVDGPALAHVASAEGIICIEAIAGLSVEPLDYGNIPACTYTSPEIASVGMTERAARDAGIAIRVGKFPFTASGKASAAGTRDGFVKLIFEEKHGELLGAHMIGANVTEMISEIVVARKLETTGHEIIKAVHPHPTMSEAIMEAAAAAYGEVIHM